MILYVDGNAFNITERKPLVGLADGTTVPWAHYAPLQSDITTLVSTALAFLRLITAAWLGPLIWRCAFILMGRPGGGLKPKQLHRMVSYGIPALSGKGGRIIWLILAVVLPVHIVAPVLTGSITWVSYNQRTERPADSIISVPAVTSPSNWKEWNQYTPRRDRVCLQAAGFATIAWGQDSQDGGHSNAMKRVIPSASQLETNSTLSNVTLPYFSVTSIEWVEDPQATLAPNQLNMSVIVCTNLKLYYVIECPLLRALGTLALIPDAPSGWTNRTFPSPLTVSETRLMVLYTYWRRNESYSCPTLATAGSYPEAARGDCWAYAWVTYTAGASICTNCRLSSYSTVQNDEEASVIGDSVASEALLMMPIVISMMIAMNPSTFSLQGDIDEYVIRLLSRSYAVSWSALTDWMGLLQPTLSTTYNAAIPSSQALVNSRRVYLWFGIQLLITASGIAFVYVQATSEHPIIGDTTLVAFYLDSGNASARYPEIRDGPMRKLEYDGNRLRVDVG